MLCIDMAVQLFLVLLISLGYTKVVQGSTMGKKLLIRFNLFKENVRHCQLPIYQLEQLLFKKIPGVK